MSEPRAPENESDRLERLVRAFTVLAAILALLLVAGAFLGLQASVLGGLRAIGPEAYVILSVSLLGALVVAEWNRLRHTNRFALIAFTGFAILAIGWILRSV